MSDLPDRVLRKTVAAESCSEFPCPACMAITTRAASLLSWNLIKKSDHLNPLDPSISSTNEQSVNITDTQLPLAMIGRHGQSNHLAKQLARHEKVEDCGHVEQFGKHMEKQHLIREASQRWLAWIILPRS
jgi:hypothetical protein